VALRLVAFVLYIPPLLAISALVFRTLQLLLVGQAAGLFGLLYAGAVFLLGRRAVRMLKDPTRKPWADVALLSAADLLLLGLALADPGR
jgi:hypothetical protein